MSTTTIDTLTDLLNDNPSLKAKLPEAIAKANRDATLLAAGETTLPKATFPATCPWSSDQIMDETFWPGAG
jgi:hypothetical protein